MLNVTPRGIYLGAGPVAETELEEALRALHAQAVGDLLILSAHRDIDAGVITRVTRAAAAAGFPDVLLAVQQRERR